MASLIDRLRSGTESWATAQIHGFDPDLSTCGHAIILVHYRTDVLGVFKIDSVIMSRIEVACDKLKGLPKACSMVDAIHKYELYSTVIALSFVESQQVYPDPDMDRGEMVAKANDLLRLAHVSGAYHQKALDADHAVYVMLPHEWKGNRPKEAMHADVVRDIKAQASPGISNPFRLMKMQSDGTQTHERFNLTEEWRLKPSNFHTMDALCLAHKGLLRLVRGDATYLRLPNGQPPC